MLVHHPAAPMTARPRKINLGRTIILLPQIRVIVIVIATRTEIVTVNRAVNPFTPPRAAP